MSLELYSFTMVLKKTQMICKSLKCPWARAFRKQKEVLSLNRENSPKAEPQNKL